MGVMSESIYDGGSINQGKDTSWIHWLTYPHIPTEGVVYTSSLITPDGCIIIRGHFITSPNNALFYKGTSLKNDHTFLFLKIPPQNGSRWMTSNGSCLARTSFSGKKSHSWSPRYQNNHIRNLDCNRWLHPMPLRWPLQISTRPALANERVRFWRCSTALGGISNNLYTIYYDNRW